MSENKESKDHVTSSSDSPEIEARIERLQLELRKQEVASREARLELQKQLLESKKPGEDKKPWWTTSIQFLGLPALLVLMFLQLNQATSASKGGKKADAEAELALTRELTARVELQMQLAELEKKKLEGAAEYQAALNSALPRIQNLLEQLERARAVGSIPILFSKFLILWSIWIGVGLVFAIFGGLWNAVVGSLIGSVFAYRDREKPSKRREQFRRVTQVVGPAFYSVPAVVQWAVQIFVFVALVVPFFDEIAGALGSTTTFESVFDSVRSFNLGEAIEKVRSMLFP